MAMATVRRAASAEHSEDRKVSWKAWVAITACTAPFVASGVSWFYEQFRIKSRDERIERLEEKVKSVEADLDHAKLETREEHANGVVKDGEVGMLKRQLAEFGEKFRTLPPDVQGWIKERDSLKEQVGKAAVRVDELEKEKNNKMIELAGKSMLADLVGKQLKELQEGTKDAQQQLARAKDESAAAAKERDALREQLAQIKTQLEQAKGEAAAARTSLADAQRQLDDARRGQGTAMVSGTGGRGSPTATDPRSSGSVGSSAGTFTRAKWDNFYADYKDTTQARKRKYFEGSVRSLLGPPDRVDADTDNHVLWVYRDEAGAEYKVQLHSVGTGSRTVTTVILPTPTGPSPSP